MKLSESISDTNAIWLILSSLLAIAVGAVITFAVSPANTQHIASLTSPSVALAYEGGSDSGSSDKAGSVKLGGTTVRGWTPDEMVDSNINIDEHSAEDLTNRLNDALKRFVQMILPLLAVLSVGVIIYNALRNIFVSDEQKRPLKNVIKEIFLGFFFIIFAWLIVECILFIINFGGNFATEILYS